MARKLPIDEVCRLIDNAESWQYGVFGYIGSGKGYEIAVDETGSDPFLPFLPRYIVEVDFKEKQERLGETYISLRIWKRIGRIKKKFDRAEIEEFDREYRTHIF